MSKKSVKKYKWELQGFYEGGGSFGGWYRTRKEARAEIVREINAGWKIISFKITK